MTEDVLSAIKVSRISGVLGCSVNGSSLHEDQALTVARIKPEEVSVFFDNDNRIVQKNQKKAKKMLEPLVPGAVKVIESDRDPKEHSDRELEELIK